VEHCLPEDRVVWVCNGQGVFEWFKKIYRTKQMKAATVQCTNTALNNI